MELFWLALIFLGVSSFTYGILVSRQDYTEPR
jgi:hypothetical protein